MSDCNVKEVVLETLNLFNPETTVGELIKLIENKDVDLAEMICSISEENIEENLQN